MKNEQLENTVIYMHLQQGKSIRKIAEELMISRERVARIIEQHHKQRNENEVLTSPQKRASILDPYKDQIHQIIKQYEKPTAQRIFEIIKESGYPGKITIVEEYVSKIKNDNKRKEIRCVETSPGQRASHDWSEYFVDFMDAPSKKIIILSYILNYSRRQYLEIVPDKTQLTLFNCMVRAFIYFNGVPRQIKSDNQKACVDRWEYGHPVYNRQYLSFASHYGFTPLTITPGKPTENLKVERPFYYLETNFFNARKFRNEQDLKEQLENWLTSVNDMRVHRTTGKTPLELYKEELPYLIPLPRVHYDTSTIEYRVVNRESCIQWQNYYYYVPQNHLFESCQVRATSDIIFIYSSDFKLIVSYSLAKPGQKERYIGIKQQSDKQVNLKNEEIKQRLFEMGEPMIGYVQIQLKLKQRPALIELLSLKVTYSTADILKAVGRAMEYGTYDIRSLKNFLKNYATPRNGFRSLFSNNLNHEE